MTKSRFAALTEPEVEALIRDKAELVLNLASSKSWHSVAEEAEAVLIEIGELFEAKAELGRNRMRG